MFRYIRSSYPLYNIPRTSENARFHHRNVIMWVQEATTNQIYGVYNMFIGGRDDLRMLVTAADGSSLESVDEPLIERFATCPGDCSCPSGQICEESMEARASWYNRVFPNGTDSPTVLAYPEEDRYGPPEVAWAGHAHLDQQIQTSFDTFLRDEYGFESTANMMQRDGNITCIEQTYEKANGKPVMLVSVINKAITTPAGLKPLPQRLVSKEGIEYEIHRIHGEYAVRI